MTISRRELFGFLRRPAPVEAPAPVAAPTPAPPPPEPAPEPAAFSLDSFYRARSPAPTLPVFTVRTPEAHTIAPHATTRVGAGPMTRAEAAGRDAAPAIAIAPDHVPRVLESACLATRSFCSVCVERCPRPGAIVVAHGRPHVVPDACDGCGRCVAACPAPVLAFTLVARPRPPRLEEIPDV